MDKLGRWTTRPAIFAVWKMGYENFFCFGFLQYLAFRCGWEKHDSDHMVTIIMKMTLSIWQMYSISLSCYTMKLRGTISIAFILSRTSVSCYCTSTALQEYIVYYVEQNNSLKSILRRECCKRHLPPSSKKFKFLHCNRYLPLLSAKRNLYFSYIASSFMMQNFRVKTPDLNKSNILHSPIFSSPQNVDYFEIEISMKSTWKSSWR